MVLFSASGLSYTDNRFIYAFIAVSPHFREGGGDRDILASRLIYG